MMIQQAFARPWIRSTAKVFSTINLVLALNFFPIVPLFGWLNYGHAIWAVSWIPDSILLLWLPAGYYVYWHGGAIIGLIALGMTWGLYRHIQDHSTLIMTVFNGTAVLVYFVIRLIFAFLGIHPDIV
jgi:hypothetical protein